jgi:hypothetical protein
VPWTTVAIVWNDGRSTPCPKGVLKAISLPAKTNWHYSKNMPMQNEFFVKDAIIYYAMRYGR